MEVIRFSRILICSSFLFCITRSHGYMVPKDPYFKQISHSDAFAPSNYGYGYLVPKGTGSEMGVYTSQLKCSQSSLESSTSNSESLQAELKALKIILARVAGVELEAALEEPFKGYKDLFDDSKIFYSSTKKLGGLVFSTGGDRARWNSLTSDQKQFAEKYIHISTRLEGIENIKAVFLLEVLKMKTGQTYRNLEAIIEQTFFLVDEEYKAKTLELVKALLGLDDQKLADLINKEANKDFYKVREFEGKIDQKYRRSLRIAKVRDQETPGTVFKEFHFSKISSLVNYNLNEKLLKLAHLQLYAQGDLAQIPCQSTAKLLLECSGVNRLGAKTTVGGRAQLEYFGADRSYSIQEFSDRFVVDFSLQFALARDAMDGWAIKQDDAVSLLGGWQEKLSRFYGNIQTVRGKSVEFKFDLGLSGGDGDTNLRECWNASRMSSDCRLPSQPDVQNFVFSMPDDVLLEEIGHKMGLLDEYRAHYYLYTPVGASDSFMTADQDFKLYPHHLEMILAPHFYCNEANQAGEIQ